MRSRPLAVERDKRAELRGLLELANLRLFLAPEGGAQQVLAIADQALPVLEQLDDDRSLGRIWYAVAFVRGGLHCRYGESAQAAERAQRSFRRSGWPVAPCLQELAAALYYGPAAVSARWMRWRGCSLSPIVAGGPMCWRFAPGWRRWLAVSTTRARLRARPARSMTTSAGRQRLDELCDGRRRY